MTMRLLLVEDNVDFAKTLNRELGKISNCEVIWARSRDEAFAKLAEGSFDLVILDRRLPAANDDMDDAPEHGWSVFQSIREQTPGTSVFFLTGTEDADFATDVLNQFSRVEDVHGRGVPEQMYPVFWKKRVTECVARVREFAAHRATLEMIAVRPQECRPLKPLEIQVVRLFGRRNGGVSVQVDELSGGLSDSLVLKVIVRRPDDGFITAAVAKVSAISVIEDEGSRYQGDIVHLTAGGFPVLAETIKVGASDRGGLFYAMVGDQVESLFDRIVGNHSEVPHFPSAIQAIEAPWYLGKATETVPVSRIRRAIVPDTDLSDIVLELGGIDIGQIEARQVLAAPCCQHGDLHCANIVFDQRGQPMLIDFGDAGRSFASVDPVTLELSTVFHKQSNRLPNDWPTEVLISQWHNVDEYVRGCSFQGFIRSCRMWALTVAGSSGEVSAVAYAYALRQLKYSDTNKKFALALIQACIAEVVA